MSNKVVKIVIMPKSKEGCNGCPQLIRIRYVSSATNVEHCGGKSGKFPYIYVAERCVCSLFGVLDSEYTRAKKCPGNGTYGLFPLGEKNK